MHIQKPFEAQLLTNIFFEGAHGAQKLKINAFQFVDMLQNYFARQHTSGANASKMAALQSPARGQSQPCTVMLTSSFHLDLFIGFGFAVCLKMVTLVRCTKI